MRSRPERVNGHTGTETRPRLLREAAVGNLPQWAMTVPEKKAPANYVPAAAVIRRGQALSGIIGRKARAGGSLSLVFKCGAQPRDALETGELECRRGERNSTCSGEMRRDVEEHQWRRRLSGL